MTTLRCMNKDCKKEFPVAARKYVRKKTQGFPQPEVELIVYACCPYCHCIDLEEVK